MDTLLSDIRYAVRMLWKTRGLTLVALVSLAAGIGCNAAIFSLVNSLLLRPRAVSQPQELVQLYVGDRRQRYEGTSYPSYLELRERNEVFTGLAAYSVGWQFRLGGSGDAEAQPVWGELVSGNYFDVLGVRPYRGRTFLPDEDVVPDRNPVVVIGFGLWQRRFAADPDLIGKTIRINNQALTVVGIAPPEYSGITSGWATEIWVPTMMTPMLDPSRGLRQLTSRGNRWVTMVGRLKPGISVDQARSRVEVLTGQMQAAHSQEWASRYDDGSVRELFISLVPESESRVHPQMRAPAYALTALLFVIVDLMLIIACMNLASLLLARAVARRSEIGIRLAVGASRWRIVRQLLTESVLLSLCAGFAGAVLALWGLQALVAAMPVLPEGIRVAVNVHVDWRVLVYTIAFATLTGLLFGLAPALHASTAPLSTILKDDATVTARFRRSRVRASLVVAQVAFSLLLLLGAGLVLRSLERVRPTRLGFASERILVAPLALDDATYDRRRAQRFYDELSDAIAGLPGVQAVSLVEGIPGGFMSRSRRSTEIEGYVARADESLEIDAAIVGPGYFTNMQVPFVSGRDFSQRDRDGAPCVAIINEAFAQRYLPGAPAALGRHLASFESGQRQMCEIVGVVRDDDWQSLNKEVRPFFALPLLQSDQRRMTLMIHAAGDPAALVPSARQAIRRLDPDMPVTDVQTLGQYFGVALYPFRLLGIVMAGCGAMALLLAVVGIYGIISYSVAQRAREVGIRIALGAARTDILKLVVGQGMLPVGWGLAAGLVLGVALTRVLTILPIETTLLFGVGATDALTFGGVTVLLALVALVACYLPAQRAAKADPMVVLRGS
jgi:predicted permease